MKKSKSEELISIIDFARSKIKKIGGQGQFDKFVQKSRGSRSGMSKSSITYLRKLLQKDLDEGALVSLEKKVLDFESMVSDFVAKESVSGIRQFYNTKWYLYFHYSQKDIQHLSMLGRVILNIDDEGVVHVKNIEDGKSMDYEGTLKYINDTVGFFQLQGKIEGANLNLKVEFGPKIPELALGISLGYELNNIISGSVILTRITKNTDNISSDRLVYTDDEFKNVPKSIRRFLALKSNNRIKSPHNIYTSEQLNNFLVNYRRDKRTLFYDYDTPRVFISTPTDSIDSKNHKSKSKVIGSIVDKLTQTFTSENIPIVIDYPGEKNLETRKKEKPLEQHRLFIENLEKLKHTKYCIVICDSPRHTKSMVELGAALVLTKVVLVFYLKDVGFPEDISVLQRSGRFRYFSIERLSGPLEENKDYIYAKIYETIVDHLKDVNTVYL